MKKRIYNSQTSREEKRNNKYSTNQKEDKEKGTQISNKKKNKQ